MGYRVVKKFKDLQDGNFIYEIGDEFPREGQKATKKRLAELSEVHPKYKVVFIEKIEEKV